MTSPAMTALERARQAWEQTSDQLMIPLNRPCQSSRPVESPGAWEAVMAARSVERADQARPTEHESGNEGPDHRLLTAADGNPRPAQPSASPVPSPPLGQAAGHFPSGDADDLDLCAKAFDRWMAVGRSAPRDPTFGEQLACFLAFRHGWRDAQEGRGDFPRRRYTGDEQNAYMTGRLLAPRPKETP